MGFKICGYVFLRIFAIVFRRIAVWCLLEQCIGSIRYSERFLDHQKVTNWLNSENLREPSNKGLS